MGTTWSEDGRDKVDKAAMSDKACSSFYLQFRRNLAEVAWQRQTSITQEQLVLTLADWERELSGGVAPSDILPVPVATRHELVFDGKATCEPLLDDGPVTLEETILKGLCSNPLSTSDSIYRSIQQVHKRLDGDAFLRCVGKYPRAAQLFSSQQLVGHQDATDSLRMSVLQQNYSQAATSVGKLAFGDISLDTKRHRLQEVSNLLQAYLDTSAPSYTSLVSLSATERHAMYRARSTASFNQVMTKEQLELLATQQSMEHTLALPTGLLSGSSLIETIQKLITLHAVDPRALLLAVECAERYNVPPRQFWWSLLRVLAQTEQGETLWVLVQGSRPPIGYVPIVEVMLDNKNYDGVQRLVSLMTDEAERAQVVALLAQDEDEEVPFDTL